MAAFSGTAGSVVFGTATVDLVKEWSLDFSMSPVETTVFGENWDSYQPNVRNVTGSFSGFKNFGVSNPTSNAVMNAFLSGSVVALLFYEDATKDWNVSNAVFTGMSETLSVKGTDETSYNFQGIGSVVYN